MTLYLIGLGLSDEKDISVKGLEIVRKCDKIYLENYTSLLQCTIYDLEKFYGKKITLADREMTEQGEDHLLEEAQDKEVAFLIVGDPFSATTHIEFLKQALARGVELKVINNASILTAIGITGLQLYKFGKTTSIPFIEEHPHLETPYQVYKENHNLGLHTLFLLDLKPKEHKFLSIKRALETLEQIEEHKKEGFITKKTKVVGCARLGSDNYVIKYGALEEIKEKDFGKPPYCLIIPGKMHFLEEEMLELWK
jgi:diphthine synthase